MPLIKPELNIGFLLVPGFTMLALAAFVDTLRLAADEGDRSRPIHCRWTVMSIDGNGVRASNGLQLQPQSGTVDPAEFDYLAVVSGTMHDDLPIDPAITAYLARAAAAHVPLVGVCTGGFVLARAGLMRQRRCCISWFHQAELAAEFPDVDVVGDQLFVVDHDRITCAGGTGVIHLASYLINKHVGAGRSDKGLRVMLEDRLRPAASPQPPPSVPGLDAVRDPRVRRAMLLIERHLARAEPIERIAAAVGTTPRHLHRLFVEAVGTSPARFRERLRLARARDLVLGSRLPFTTIAFQHGFADAAHFSRSYRTAFGTTPGQSRKAQAAA